MNLKEWLKDYFLKPTWADSNKEVFVVGAYMQIFCAAVAFCTALAVLIEIRKGPWFITRVLIAILMVCISILIVQTGIILDWFDTHVMNAVGTFFFCMYIFLDLEIYWTFASRYWETSFHISSYFKRLVAEACEDEVLRSKLSERQKSRSKCLFNLRLMYGIMAFICVFGWGIADAILDFYTPNDPKTGFLEKYTQEGLRSALFGAVNYLWLGFRFMSITFFANALCRFWFVFKEVKDELLAEPQ